jgi:hypothetical protein
MKLSDDQIAAAIKQLAATCRDRRYVTYAQLDAVLPVGQVSSEQIEDAMSLLAELGINVVEAVLRAQPIQGEIDYAELSREHIARYPEIRARLAE